MWWVLAWCWLVAGPRVFLSYAHADATAAAAAAGELARAGCVVWFDRRQLAPGDRWARRIEQAMDAATVVVALIGQDCQTCRDEIARAIRTGKRIVPVLLKPDAAVPLQLEQRLFLPLDRLGELCAPQLSVVLGQPGRQ